MSETARQFARERDVESQPDSAASRLNTRRLEVEPTAPLLDITEEYGTLEDGTLVPFLGITDGTLLGSFSHMASDDNGNVFLVEGIADGPTEPVHTLRSYVNGELLVELQMSWTPVTGGSILTDAVLLGIAEGEVATRIESTINPLPPLDDSGGGGTGLGMLPPALGSSLLAVREATSRILCTVLPSVAHAQVRNKCGLQIAAFGLSTFGLGVHSVAFGATFPIAWWTASAYYGNWMLWTYSLYTMLDCIDKARRTP